MYAKMFTKCFCHQLHVKLQNIKAKSQKGIIYLRNLRNRNIFEKRCFSEVKIDKISIIIYIFWLMFFIFAIRFIHGEFDVFWNQEYVGTG